MSGKTTALNFDASTVKPSKPNELIPAGWYNAEITDAEVLATKGAGAGKRVKFEYTVCEGEFKGWKVFGNVNTQNKSAQAQEIGQRELSAICHATGVIIVSDVSQFKGKRLQVKVKVKAADGEYEAQNEPRAYKALEGGIPASAPGFVPSAPGAPPMAPPAPPAPPAAFPPAPWVAHPQSPGFYWNQATNEVFPEAQLRASLAPAAPPAPPAPIAAPMPPPVPMAPPVPVAAPFPPAGWVQHPQSPGWFYESANPANMKAEADLRNAAPSAPAVPAVPEAPAAGSVPPWQRPPGA